VSSVEIFGVSSVFLGPLSNEDSASCHDFETKWIPAFINLNEAVMRQATLCAVDRPRDNAGDGSWDGVAQERLLVNLPTSDIIRFRTIRPVSTRPRQQIRRNPFLLSGH